MAYRIVPTEDLTGKIFGRLTVTGTDSTTHARSTMWNCRCQCGNVCAVRAASLIDGITRSCGCLKKEFYASKPADQPHKIPGVYRSGKSWSARITVDGLMFDLGTYQTPEEAASIRTQAEEHRPNFTVWYCEWLTNRTESRLHEKLNARKDKSNA